MTLDDLQQVLEVERSCYDFPWSEGIIRDCLKAGYHIVVATRLDCIVGFVILLLAADEAHILNLCVLPVERKQGVAGHLLDAAVSRAVEARAREVLLEVRSSNEIAQRLYQVNGFKQIARRPDYYKSASEREREREDALVFSLKLTSFDEMSPAY